MKRGNYLGTVVDGKWWKRYREHGFFARGNGDFDLDATGISFRKKLTQEPLVIAWNEISATRLGKWHAGRWAMGRPILRVEFTRDGRSLCAGFLLSRSWDEMAQLGSDIAERSAR